MSNAQIVYVKKLTNSFVTFVYHNGSENVHARYVSGAIFPWPEISSPSHNLEYDSSEEVNPRLIFYDDKDEVVKVTLDMPTLGNSD